MPPHFLSEPTTMTDRPASQIDGTAIAKMFERTIDNELSIIRHQAEERYPHLQLRPPVLVSFANPNDPASVKYTRLKQAKAAEHGIEFKVVFITLDTTKQDVQNLLTKFNQQGTIDGIMFQLPLPPHLSKYCADLIGGIQPDKDVDGLTNSGRQTYRPATIEGIFQILQTQNTNLQDKIVAVAGSRGEVGRELVQEITKHHPKSIIQVDLKIPGTSFDDLKSADIVFACLPSQVQIPDNALKPGVIAYDVGLGNFGAGIGQVASQFTPPRGGVGPNTVIALLRNLVRAYVAHTKTAYGLT